MNTFFLYNLRTDLSQFKNDESPKLPVPEIEPGSHIQSRARAHCAREVLNRK